MNRQYIEAHQTVVLKQQRHESPMNSHQCDNMILFYSKTTENHILTADSYPGNSVQQLPKSDARHHGSSVAEPRGSFISGIIK